jgi:hypothetical protein
MIITGRRLVHFGKNGGHLKFCVSVRVGAQFTRLKSAAVSPYFGKPMPKTVKLELDDAKFPFAGTAVKNISADV